jgi:dienelactone hydrolase
MARVIVLPDADQTPGQLVGITPGLNEDAQWARRLAENGVEVLVPQLISRASDFSGNPAVRMTNQPHREWLHRQLVPVGRHLLGVELQKVLAALDWSASIVPSVPLGVAGYGEGGLIALLAGAADQRLDSVLVGGAFGPIENLWEQPIYRSLWGQALQFGHAELAALVAPRTLVIEACRHPEVAGPPAETGEGPQRRRGAAPGKIETPSLAAVEREFQRAQKAYAGAGAVAKIKLIASSGGTGEFGTREALQAFTAGLRIPGALSPPMAAPKDERPDFNPQERQREQVLQIQEYAQRLVRQSESVRKEFWKLADVTTPAGLERAVPAYRKVLWQEVLGKLPDPSAPLKAETRLVYNTEKFAGYEVVLPVWPDVDAYGVLLLPKDLKPGERRPVVVVQHGLEGRPQDLIEPKDDRAKDVYKRFGAALAERGFIVYAPQNPYIGGEKFRVLLRKAAPLKLSLFSFIIGQHSRTLDWLASLPFVDELRIGFYGLSYGGKTTMRVPPLLDRYALAICSGDFNEWIWKVTSVTEPFSYMFTHEYDMLEWNLANTFNYADMATLIAPRPFMVERAHRDPVGIDEWVSYEYAKVRRLYAFLEIPERTEIEYFNGVHQINGVGTFEFLHRFLNWPKR